LQKVSVDFPIARTSTESCVMITDPIKFWVGACNVNDRHSVLSDTYSCVSACVSCVYLQHMYMHMLCVWEASVWQPLQGMVESLDAPRRPFPVLLYIPSITSSTGHRGKASAPISFFPGVCFQIENCKEGASFLKNSRLYLEISLVLYRIDDCSEGFSIFILIWNLGQRPNGTLSRSP
jgi:hypothetical protein